MSAVRPRHLLVLLVVMALAMTTLLPTAAAAPPAPSAPPEGYVVGGCRIEFGTTGTPRVVASRDKPCVGVRSVRRSALGDVEVSLTPEASQTAIRLMTQPGSALADRGIFTGVTGGRDTLTVRMYDDRISGRVDLRRFADRARVAGTHLWVGWTKKAPSGKPLDPGFNALGAHRDLTATTAQTVPGGCVVRVASTGPWIHANGTHRCIGATSVRISTTGKIVLTFAPEQRGAFVNVQADPDETLTARGLSTGLSVSQAEMIISVYDSRLNRRLDLRRAPELKRVAGTYANLWLAWTKTSARPGSPNASSTPSSNTYGPYIDGSTRSTDILQSGCTVQFSSSTSLVQLQGNVVRSCTEVTGTAVNDSGEVEVYGVKGAPIVATTSVSSRTLADYGVRAGASGGNDKTRYRLYSWRLNRPLDLRSSADRKRLQINGTALLVGWSRYVGPDR
ncbi:hypothetical protein [Janibacter sp. G368]|uniref:hypothetical protein n=1 Tax=Janibacter sp. G368 TaxID=3420441 RepID=UPI003D08A874